MKTLKASSTEQSPKRGVYLLPNLLTTVALFSGFYAIVAAMNELFEVATEAIFIAMIMDSLDGRVARMTGTQSAFGGQYDSLSDMVSFGLAPALVVYSWSLSSLGKFGWLVSFLYAASVALRLARFNVQANQEENKSFFIGLPCPSGAGVLTAIVWLTVDEGILGQDINYVIAVIAIVVALLMVSSVKFYSFKEIDLKGKVPFMAVIIFILIMILIAWDPPKVLFSVFFIYLLSGIFSLLKNQSMLKFKK